MSTLQVENLIGPTSGSNANKVIIPSGQTLYAPGHVIQVVSVASTATTTTQSGSFVSTGCAASITPKFNNSKILITINGGMEGFAGGGATEVSSWKIFRGSTQVETSDSGKRIYLESNKYVPLTTVFLDSPATTSSTTYTLHMKRYAGSGTVSWNRDGLQTTTITLQEIAQ
jgi:hypothetical protein